MLIEQTRIDGITIWVDDEIVVYPIDDRPGVRVYVVSEFQTWVDGVYETKEGAARAPRMNVSAIASLAKANDVITDAQLNALAIPTPRGHPRGERER